MHDVLISLQIFNYVEDLKTSCAYLETLLKDRPNDYEFIFLLLRTYFLKSKQIEKCSEIITRKPYPNLIKLICDFDIYVPNLIDNLAKNNHLPTLKYVHDQTKVKGTTTAIDKAASNGYLDMVVFLYENRKEGFTTDALVYAAKHKHFGIVRYLYQRAKPIIPIRSMYHMKHYLDSETYNYICNDISLYKKIMVHLVFVSTSVIKSCFRFVKLYFVY